MKPMQVAHDETNVTDLEIGPDGRVYVFGASPEVLAILSGLNSQGETLPARMDRSSTATAEGRLNSTVRNAGTS